MESTLSTLEQRGYVQEVGHDPGPGQAILYGTTPLFLELLALRDLTDLPKAEELTIALQPHRPETQGEDDAAAYVPAES